MGYILFNSNDKFFIQADKTWDGTIEYSFDNSKWIKWHGEKIINNVIYMRGINNTVINNQNHWLEYPSAWCVIGKNIRCQGNIENLLDYKSVINNVHPKMGLECFSRMFFWCTSLVEAPQLLATDLTDNCYWRMFNHCTSLITSPMFPNLTIAKESIINQHMFDDCHIQNININNQLYDINVLKLL